MTHPAAQNGRAAAPNADQPTHLTLFTRRLSAKAVWAPPAQFAVLRPVIAALHAVQRSLHAAAPPAHLDPPALTTG